MRKSGVHWIDENGNVKSPGGTFLDKFLQKIGYSLDPKKAFYLRPYTTNVLHCWTGRKGKRDRIPTKTELETCKYWWMKEFGIIKPKSVLLMGKPASESFGKMFDIKKDFSQLLHEQQLIVSFGNLSIKLFFLPHPTAPYKGKSELYEAVFKEIASNI